ncbi:hypothetical protein A0256_17730 [Mucilaginibacter sp. PAMC 26640]|nr:hypothetical protein A0256_17730 [Mucilaginibacter sp. PAMC 26640]
MKKLLPAAFLFVTIVNAHAQSPQAKTDSVSPQNSFIEYEVSPKFPGGEDAFKNFIKENLRWPKNDPQIEGKVIITFIIQKDGRLTNFKILKSLRPAYNKEALRILKASPKWTPGMQMGKPIVVAYTVPIIFSAAKSY